MSAFDAYAKKYDTDFSDSTIGKCQRDSVHRYLLKMPLQNAKVLDVGGGTGVDALFFSEVALEVVYSDASSEMKKVADSRLSAKTNVKTVLKPAQELIEEFTDKQLIYSGFGALNCLSPHELIAFSQQIQSKNAESVDLIMVVMGRSCIWERIYFGLKGNKIEKGRRIAKGPVMANAGKGKIATWYYSPNELQTLFGVKFKLIRKVPVGLFVPPSYLQPFFNKHPFLLHVLKIVDKSCRWMGWTANYADHFLIHLKLTVAK